MLIQVLLLIACASTPEKDSWRQIAENLNSFHSSKPVPGYTLDKAIDHVIDRVGVDFFRNHISYTSGFGDEDLYLTRWWVHFDSLSGAKQIFFIVLNPDGETKSPIDLPDCAREPSTCDVNIDTDRAEAIAASALEIDKYELIDIDFRYGGPKYDCFVWLISLRPPKVSREHGKTVIIHAATGHILEERNFRRYKRPYPVPHN